APHYPRILGKARSGADTPGKARGGAGPIDAPDVVVLMFGGDRARRASRTVPRPLRGLAVVGPDDIDAALVAVRRVVVVGADADLASLLTGLLRAELLN